jgi:hypothetical protein
MQIEFIEREGRDRELAEAHVRAVYRETYGAELRDFAPLLVAASDSAGQIACVAGIRIARDGFFSGVYLDQPLDQALSDFGAGPVSADTILEVVSLASTSPFPVLPVLDAIIAWGRRRSITWGVFTATAALRRLLTRAGMPYAEICAARPQRLADPSAWGSYYASDPRVCAFSDTLREPLVLSKRMSLRAEAR